MRSLLILTAVLAASASIGCTEVAEMRSGPDQCLRPVLFQQCMAALPAGPVSTKYNDWDEVVDSCAQTAYHQSIRTLAQVKPECRP